MLKHSAVPKTEAPNGAELRDATFASLEGHASTEAAQALTEAVNEQVLRLLAHREFFGNSKANRNKLKPADSDDLARVYRFDLAQDSEMISPTIPI